MVFLSIGLVGNCLRFPVKDANPIPKKYFDLEKLGEISTIPLSDLRHLELHAKEFRSKDLEKLPSLPNLEFLSLGGTEIDSLQRFNSKDFPKLATLYLEDTPVTNSTFQTWIHPPQITKLFINRTKVTSLDWVEKFPKLRHLNIEHTDISDISPLEKNKYLIKLWMGWTNVQDILPLKNNTYLSYIGLDLLLIPQEQLDEIRKINPYVKFVNFSPIMP